jgi:hypothetical protein
MIDMELVADAAREPAGSGVDPGLGCSEAGKHRLGLRCRVMREPSPIRGKRKTHALWSAESDAYLCDKHALSGLDVTLLIETNRTGAVALRALSGGRAGEPRRVAIKQSAK